MKKLMLAVMIAAIGTTASAYSKKSGYLTYYQGHTFRLETVKHKQIGDAEGHITAFFMDGVNLLKGANSKNRKAVRIAIDGNQQPNTIGGNGVRDYLAEVAIEAKKIGEYGWDCGWDNWSVDNQAYFRFHNKVLNQNSQWLTSWMLSVSNRYGNRTVQDIATAACKIGAK